jgi:heptosyltransferase-3
VLNAPASVRIVCMRRIGDVLLATPLIRSVRRAWPRARVDVVVFEGTQGVLVGNPDLDGILAVPARQSLSQRIALMRQHWREADFALSVLASDRAILNAWAMGRRRVGVVEPDTPAWKRALLHATVPFDDLATHTVAMNLRLCGALGIAPVHEVVPGYLPENAVTAAAALPFDPGREPFAVVHVSPKFAYKRWTTDGWVALVRWLRSQGLRVVLTGGRDPEEQAELARVLVHVAPLAIDLSARLSLATVTALLQRAALYVGPDTAVTHLAAATGIPVVALFGPSNPVKWGPWPVGCTADASPWRMRGTQRVGNVTLVQGAGECVPCREEGCDRHVGSFSRCLTGMTAAVVIAAADRALRTPDAEGAPAGRGPDVEAQGSVVPGR